VFQAEIKKKDELIEKLLDEIRSKKW
jgi:hypothetical protein